MLYRDLMKFVNLGSSSIKEIIMLKNKKFLIGFFTCASLILIMAHDYNNNHNHNEYADSYHSHSSSLSDNYAEEGHTHDGWNGYAKQTDVSDLEARIEDLESEIQRLRNHDH